MKNLYTYTLISLITCNILFAQSSLPECNGSPGDDSQPMMNPQNMMIHTTLTTAQAPDAWAQLDILPNGFKIRGQWAPINTSDSDGLIWVAFARNSTTTLFGGQSLSM